MEVAKTATSFLFWNFRTLVCIITLFITVVTSDLADIFLFGTSIVLLLLLSIPIASGLRCVNARGWSIGILLILALLPLLFIRRLCISILEGRS